MTRIVPQRRDREKGQSGIEKIVKHSLNSSDDFLRVTSTFFQIFSPTQECCRLHRGVDNLGNAVCSVCSLFKLMPG